MSDVNIITWAYAADWTCGGAEMVASRELLGDDGAMPARLREIVSRTIRGHFYSHGAIPEVGPFYAILEPNPPFRIIKEGTL